MANHLTPEELSKEMGLERQEVIRVCVEEGVPIYQGKIDKTLFQAQLQAMGGPPTPTQRAGPHTFGLRPRAERASDARAWPARRRFRRHFLAAALARGARFLAGAFGFSPSETCWPRRRRAPMRSTTGLSGTGSGRLISWPASLASSISRSSRRYWFSND